MKMLVENVIELFMWAYKASNNFVDRTNWEGLELSVYIPMIMWYMSILSYMAYYFWIFVIFMSGFFFCKCEKEIEKFFKELKNNLNRNTDQPIED